QLYTANWDFICEVRETVELTDTPINIGGGSDSDDNSGGEPCTEVEVTVGSGSIGISNINAANKLIKLFDADYKVVEECVNNCGDPAILSRPANGDYLVDVQLYSADWQFICETQIPINVTNTTDGGNGNGVGGDNGNNGDGNTNGDNLCDNVNITYSTSAITLNNFKAPNKIVNVFDENYNQIYTCFTDCTTEVVAPISGIGTYLIDVQLYTDDWSLVCQQRTTLEVTADGGMNDNPNGGTTDIDECANAIIATTSTTISVENLTAPNTIVKVFNENFALIFECLGNCGAAATATDLIAGDYQVNINYFDENWQPICERVEQVALANNFDALSTDRSAKTAISSDNIQIYPNPATTELMVDLSAFGNEKVTVLVYNQLAAKVQEVQFTVANHEIKQMDLRGLQAGLYLLHVQVGARSPMAKKILVQ
ncbi:MAG: T9SS type A sorting domain-containing protein, partial [Bacteroidota bacterium]